MAATFTRGTLGRTGREVFRLGISATYGLGAAGVEEAIERGVNYIYWGSLRRSGFGEGFRNACARDPRARERIVLVIQSYSRLGSLLGWSLSRALCKLKTDYADVLLLGWWNAAPPGRILDAALKLKEKGLVRHLALSTHERPLIPTIAEGPYDLFHVRYNAAHRGAEKEVFPALAKDPARRPGLVAFTATRWGSLLKPANGAQPERLPTAGECYRFVLTNPSIDAVVTGPKDTAELRHALDALERGPLPADDVTWISSHGDQVRAGSMRSA
jgi:aryl-alcohol dehydrogenase-like predicted oxidoreductase